MKISKIDSYGGFYTSTLASRYVDSCVSIDKSYFFFS